MAKTYQYASIKEQEGPNKRKDSCIAKKTEGGIDVVHLSSAQAKFVTQKKQGSTQPEDMTRALRNETREAYVLLPSV